jgi:hypothetical protein
MSKTQVFIFANEKGEAPLLKWLDKQPAKVPDREIDLAIQNSVMVEADPSRFLYKEEEGD